MCILRQKLFFHRNTDELKYTINLLETIKLYRGRLHLTGHGLLKTIGPLLL